jgi:hypothetical protein
MAKLHHLDAARLAARLDCQAVLILAVARDGTMRVVSHGETKPKAAAIGAVAADLMERSPLLSLRAALATTAEGDAPS